MKPSLMDRRRFGHLLSATALAGLVSPKFSFAQASVQKAKPALDSLNRFPTMMQEWLLSQMREAEAIGETRRAGLKSAADAKRYVETMKLFIRECFGLLPEKTPLNARTTSVLERDQYRIENVVFESLPNYLVSANLYVPKGHKGPMPAVVGLCGHSATGKGQDAYQSFAQGLARQGYVVLIFDPVGQGERVQWPTAWSKSLYKGTTSEHIQLGNQMSLLGEFLGTWFAWDGIRALDYLLSREEVDPKRVGVTGNSGGGTQTTWLAALDDRWTMAAPACFVTTFRRNAENELPADTEQCPPRVLSFGLDHSDFIACMAPKPVILLTQEKDFFDARGGAEAFERLKKLYTLLGKPENIQLQVGPDPHGYTQANREAMYRFFNKQTGVKHDGKEPTITLEKDEALWAAPGGDVGKLGSVELFKITQEKVLGLAADMKRPAKESVTHRLKEVLRLETMPERSEPPYRILRSVGARQYPGKGYCDYALATEENIELIVTRLCDEAGFTSRPPKGIKKAVLYVSHQSADAELRSESLIDDLIKAEPESAVYAMDVRGIGESQPNTCGSDTFKSPYGSHYFYAAHGLMLDRPLLGLRTLDVLRVIDWLASLGHEEIHLVGRGWGALPAAFAAVLETKVRTVTLKNALSSYVEVAADPDYRWPYALLIPGALPKLDLPEVYASLASKNLHNIEPWGSKDGMNS